MKSFEDVRAHMAAKYELRDNEPYLLSLDVEVNDQRRQSLFLAEIEGDDGRRTLRLSSPVAKLGKIDATRCLRFNWAQRVGFLAVSDLADEPFLHLCENRPYSGVGARELDYLVKEIASLADSLERLMSDGRDIT